MDLQEFRAKQLLSRYAIAIPPGALALTPDEAEAAATRLDAKTLFVKAQLHAGDRHAAGGIHTVPSPAAAKAAAAELLGRKLKTSQTSADGQTVKSVLIEAGVTAKRELYLAMRVDARAGSILLTAGDGGTGIEQRLASGAQELDTLVLGIGGERKAGDIAAFARRIGIADDRVKNFYDLVFQVHRAFIELDASLIEINPLVLTGTGAFIAVDAKVTLDDNAAFRHPDFAGWGEEQDPDRIELRAARHNINFVPMDGDVGCIVNGAGLGLATLDMIRAAGGTPANFMDIRTTATSQDIAHGIALVLDNPKAKVLLVNVFGGGMQPCDTIVDGLGIAFRKHTRVLPVVLRITGNNEELARLRLANFKIPKTECSDMWQAVVRAVAIAGGRA
jgi:succinyl-CoA synthetase beta subunit